MSAAVMRIEVSQPGRCASLRDYFLRLGAVAVVDGGSSVDVHFPDDRVNSGESVEAYLRSWVETNQVPAAVVRPSVPPVISASNGGPPLSPAPEAPPRLGDLLVAKGFITPEQLSYAVVEARERGQLLGRLLLRYEWVFESELARVLAEQWGLPYLNLASIGVNRELVKLLPREVGVRVAAVPVRRLEGATQVAFADPTDPTAQAAVRDYIPSFVPAVAELSDIESAWRSASPDRDMQSQRDAEPRAASTGVPGRPKIGELFLQKGLVTRADLEDALTEQSATGKPIGEILVARRLIDRMHLASALSKQWSAQHETEPAEEITATDNGHDDHVPDAVPYVQADDEVQGLDDAPGNEEDQTIDLVRAVVELTATVERLRAELEEQGRRPLDDPVGGFSAATI